MADQETPEGFVAKEDRVKEQSASFKKELGLTDLVFTQILFIVGLPWVGVAAKQGPSHVLYWLPAVVLFFFPSAAGVIHLNRAMPLEGGLYQWAKLGFNELTGFLVAWNLWLFAILNTSEIGMQVTQYAVYVGTWNAPLFRKRWFIALTNAVIMAALVGVGILGLGVGKWVSKTGGALMLATFGIVVLL